MSDAPGTESGTDPDAWATACEEDLAAERARRQEQYGQPPLNAAEELRRLADVVTEQLGRIGGGLGLGAAPLAAQARAALEPVIERNADVLGHLAAAGQELLAAYRSAVEDHERGWARETPAAGPKPAARKAPETGPGTGPGTEPKPEAGAGEADDDGGTGPQRIDLD